MGTANLFVFVEPLAGRRCVKMPEQCTRLDFAQTIRWLVDSVYPKALVIRLVMDNLDTHTAASLYEAFRFPATRIPVSSACCKEAALTQSAICATVRVSRSAANSTQVHERSLRHLTAVQVGEQFADPRQGH